MKTRISPLRAANFAALLLLLGFIWINSAMPAGVSASESSGVSGMLIDFFSFFGLKLTENSFIILYVRKIAHFIEYAALGGLLALLFTALPKSGKLPQRLSVQRLINAAWCALVVAVIDETIQLWSLRGSKIADVWLDLCGAIVGILLCSLICGVLICHRAKKDNKNIMKGDTNENKTV